MSPVKNRLLVALVSLFLFVRLVPLFFGIESLFYVEELIRGTIAKELIDGLKLPFIDYRPDNYHGGSLLVGPLTVPPFLLFGPNLVSLKLTALAFSLVSFLLVHHLCQKHFNQRTALIACGLFIFCPPLFSQFSLITLGAHGESILFTTASFVVLYDILFLPRRGLLQPFLLGLLCGFGVWFTYSVLLALVNALVCLSLFKREFFKEGDSRAFAGGFLIGFSPWILFNVTHAFAGLDIVRTALGIGVEFPDSGYPLLVRPIVKTAKLLIWELPSSLLFGDLWGIDGRILRYLYYGLGVFSFGWLLWLKGGSILKKDRETPLRSYVFLFLLVYASLTFSVYRAPGFDERGPYRYLMPLYPVLFILLARSLDELWGCGRWARRLSASACCLFLALGLVGNLMLVSWPLEFGRGFGYKGFSYSILEYVLKGDTSPESHIKFFDKFAEDVRPYLYRSLYWSPPHSREELSEILAQIQEQDPRYHPLLYQNLGHQIGREFSLRRDVWKDFEAEIPLAARSDFYEGLSGASRAIYYSGVLREKFQSYLDLIDHIDPPYREHFYRQLGEDLAIYAERGGDFALIDTVDPGMQWAIYQGIGRRLGSHLFDSRMLRREVLDRIDRQYLPSVYEGIGERIYVSIGEDRAYSAYLIQRVDPSFQAICLRSYEKARDRFEGRARQGHPPSLTALP